MYEQNSGKESSIAEKDDQMWTDWKDFGAGDGKPKNKEKSGPQMMVCPVASDSHSDGDRDVPHNTTLDDVTNTPIDIVRTEQSQRLRMNVDSKNVSSSLISVKVSPKIGVKEEGNGKKVKFKMEEDKNKLLSGGKNNVTERGAISPTLFKANILKKSAV